MRPCLIFQPLILKNRKNLHEKIPKNKRLTHNKIKYKRPVFKIPPCKEVSLSQRKSLNFIHKYYGENFILEEEEEQNKTSKNILLKDRQNEVIIENNKIEDNNNIATKVKEKIGIENEKVNKINNNNISNNEIKDINDDKKMLIHQF